jgi:hypothetical protein
MRDSLTLLGCSDRAREDRDQFVGFLDQRTDWCIRHRTTQANHLRSELAKSDNGE